MRKTKCLLFIIAMMMALVTLNASWIDNLECEIIQPDGTKIVAFQTGDEYHNWVHDRDNFTIIQDPKTGYWCWARATSDGWVESTGYPIHEHNPREVGVEPGENISQERYYEKRRPRDEQYFGENATRPAPTTGTIHQLFVFIKFSDSPNFAGTANQYDSMLNNPTQNADSFYRYFYDVSYQNLQVHTYLYPTQTTPNGTIVAYTSPNPRGYYQPQSPSNPIGYTGNATGSYDSTQREWELLRDAMAFIEPSCTLTGAQLDADGDGRIDNVNFMIQGQPGQWSELIWPHRWSIGVSTYGNSMNVQFKGKRVYDYNFNVEGRSSSIAGALPTLCHEFAHSLGFPDVYRYNASGTPMGQWSLMASETNPAQSPGAYLIWKYTKWFNPTVSGDGTANSSTMSARTLNITSQNGVYTLNPVSTHTTTSFYKITTGSTSSNQYYFVEYRSRETGGRIDSAIPGSGLLIYRINQNVTGTAQESSTSPGEIYVYRPGGTYDNNLTNQSGTISSAHFSANANRTAINGTTNPTPWLFTFGGILGNTINGSNANGGLNIKEIGYTGDTITFQLGELSRDLVATKITGPIRPTLNAVNTYTVSVRNDGTAAASSWTVRLMNGNNIITTSPSQTSLAANGTRDVTLTWTPIATGSYQIYGEIVFTNDQKPQNNLTNTINAGILPAADIVEPYVGSATSGTSNQNIIAFNNINSVSQTIYLASELNNRFGWIHALSLRIMAASGTVEDTDIKLYLATTTNAQFTTNTAWIPANDFTEVYSGSLNIPPGTTGDYDVEIFLQTPFEYAGGNLVLMAQRRDKLGKVYGSTGNNFQMTSHSTNKTIYVRGDGTNYNITSLPTGTRVTQHANIKFFIEKYPNYDPPANFGAPNAGTASNPYQIRTLRNLGWMSLCTDQWWRGEGVLVHFKQMNDINAAETVEWDNGAGFKPIGHTFTIGTTTADWFLGNYDGQGYSISNLHINLQSDTGITNVGLFSRMLNSTIRNLRVETANISATTSNNQLNIGALAGYITSSTIDQCLTTGTITTITGETTSYTGALVGYAFLATNITNSYSTMTINATATNDATPYVGGLVGRLENTAKISKSYTRANLTSGGRGGLIGHLHNAVVENSFWDTGTTTATQVAAIVTGTTNSITDNLGLPNTQLIFPDYYIEAEWDFTNIWGIAQTINSGYPYLKIQNDEVYNRPQNLTYQPGNGRITLSWEPPEAGSSGMIFRYYVQRNGSQIILLQTSNLTYTDTNVQNGTTYQYYITATYLTNSGTSSPSNVVFATPVDYLVAPTNLTAVIEGENAILSWEMTIADTLLSHIQGFNVFKNGSTTPLNDSLLTQMTYTDTTAINPDTQYTYTVDAIFDVATLSSSPLTIINYIYNPPQNLIATAGVEIVDLVWSPPEPQNYGTVSSYMIHRESIADTISFETTNLNTLYCDETVIAGVQYTYKVKAIYASINGESEFSDTATATPQELILTPPTNITASLDEDDVILVWELQDGYMGELIGFWVYRNEDHTPLNTEAIIDTMYYRDLSPTPDQRYTYTVTALYDIGESAHSEPDSIIVPIFNPPLNLIATASVGVVYLEWSAPEPQNFGTLVGYYVGKETAGDLVGILNNPQDPTNTYMEDTDVLHSIMYNYWVIALYENPDGESIASDTVNVSPIVPEDDLTENITITGLRGNYPNPFNPSTTIEFSVGTNNNSPIQIDIYNIKGQKVRSLVNGNYSSGIHTAVWNGKDDNGNEVTSGLYFYRLRTPDIVQTKRMLLLK